MLCQGWPVINILLFGQLWLQFPVARSDETIVGLILARGGSRGIHLKNLAQVGGSSLLSRSLGIARLAGLNDVTVSTDHPLIALEALKHDVKVFRRAKVTAGDLSPSLWGVAEFITSRSDIDIVVLLQVTSPFTRSSDLRTAIDRLRSPPRDCVFSVTRSHKLRWKLKEGRLKPINFSLRARPRRQDWSGELVETGAFYITKRKLVEQGYLQNENCSALEVAARDSLEVDSYEDLSLANLMSVSTLVH